MAIAPNFSFPHDFTEGLDELLFQVCEELQLTPSRYELAVDRYDTLNKVLESKDSPFKNFHPEIYPQGSMALGTTVKPIEGPHDLDFVLQLSRDHSTINPMALIQTLYAFLKNHGVYGPMTSLKNRCVRIEYADEFYMDVLPACGNSAAGGTCIKVPDRAAKGWSDSNPLGYIDWFKEQSKILFVERMFDKAAPVPPQQAVEEKRTLELVVQLIKRWRDRNYAKAESGLAPISIVLTTLAGHAFRGERSVSKALTTVLNGIVGFIDYARQQNTSLKVLNPSNQQENLSEKWDSNPAAYLAFEKGIRDFRRSWLQLVERQANVNSELESLFGEPVKVVLKKRAQQLQVSRSAGTIGVTYAGRIVPASSTVTPVRRNTFYGTE